MRVFCFASALYFQLERSFYDKQAKAKESIPKLDDMLTRSTQGDKRERRETHGCCQAQTMLRTNKQDVAMAVE